MNQQRPVIALPSFALSVIAALGLFALPAGSFSGSEPSRQAALQAIDLEVPDRWRAEQFNQPRQLWLPPGFRASVFASGIDSARFMALGPGGDIYLSEMRAGRVLRLHDADSDGVADEVTVFAEGLNLPHGLAFHHNWLYVGETNQVIRIADTNGDGQADQRELVVPELPSGRGHFTRTLGFGPNGMLYVSVGSSCNNCVEADERRAALLQFGPDGSGGRVFARGLRNAVGFVFHPAAGEIWATENGRDNLGDDYPPDELNLVRDGRHYGWPFCHNAQAPDPGLGDGSFCPSSEPPALGFQAHSAPLGLAFYTGQQFPTDYQGDLLVAFHGSWNRSVPTGYKLVRVRVRDGRAELYEDFAIGWLAGGEAWGRPVDVLVAPDGSLLVSDDKAGAVYRIRYLT